MKNHVFEVFEQTGIYAQSQKIVRGLDFRKKWDFISKVTKSKTLIGCAVCTFLFSYAESSFYYDTAYI